MLPRRNFAPRPNILAPHRHIISVNAPNPGGTGGGEVFGNQAGAGAFGVKAGSWRNLGAAGGLTCCGQDARGPLGGRGLGGGRRVGGFCGLWGFGGKALKTVGGTGWLATWTLGGCEVARKRRLGGEKGSFKAPDQPLAAVYRRLPPVAAAYFPMCFFVLAHGSLQTATMARRRSLRVPHAGRGTLQRKRNVSKAEEAMRIGGFVFRGLWARSGCLRSRWSRSAAKGCLRTAIMGTGGEGAEWEAGVGKQHATTRNHSQQPGGILFFCVCTQGSCGLPL
ncbi:MAG: hypothetical protein JWR26_3835 [Pedosphaera sp.]|nr:hypothetical protein [Pedosphaera sp.]